MRRIVPFSCEGRRLVGTIDEAMGTTGVLIVSGGNEVRAGAHRGMATLAQRLAGAGVPVFRFDRRGVGDSEGANGGWASSAPDIAAAIATFRREQPQVRRILGFGNCDGATALLLRDRMCDALVLANPWLGDDGAPPPAPIQGAHYARAIFRPAAWRHLFRRGIVGIVNVLRDLLRRVPQQPLAKDVAAALPRRPATVVLARGDRTAQVFAYGVRLPHSVRRVTLDTASHGFAGHDGPLAHVLLETIAALDA